MKTFEVVLTKSYIVKIKTEDGIKAKEYSEYFTNNIQNISTIEDEKQYKFKIENIDCKVNEALDVKEIYENN